VWLIQSGIYCTCNMQQWMYLVQISIKIATFLLPNADVLNPAQRCHDIDSVLSRDVWAVGVRICGCKWIHHSQSFSDYMSEVQFLNVRVIPVFITNCTLWYWQGCNHLQDFLNANKSIFQSIGEGVSQTPPAAVLKGVPSQGLHTIVCCPCVPVTLIYPAF
jgi:hypothetical protein